MTVQQIRSRTRLRRIVDKNLPNEHRTDNTRRKYANSKGIDELPTPPGSVNLIIVTADSFAPRAFLKIWKSPGRRIIENVSF